MPNSYPDLYILCPQDRSNFVLSGIWGTVEKVSENIGEDVTSTTPEQYRFHIDPDLQRCSNMFTSLANEGLLVREGDLVKVTVAGNLINSLKANLARGLQRHWDRRYAAAVNSYGGSSSALGQALTAEQKIAHQGIEDLITNLSDVAPYLIAARMEFGLWHKQEDGTVNITPDGYLFPYLFPAAIDPDTPVAIPEWGAFENPVFDPAQHPALAEATSDSQVGGKVKIPVYLPKFPSDMSDDEVKEELCNARNNLCDFITRNATLENLIVDNPAHITPVFSSMKIVEEDDTDANDDFDDDDIEGDPGPYPRHW